jgi:hypothetical protein
MMRRIALWQQIENSPNVHDAGSKDDLTGSRHPNENSQRPAPTGKSRHDEIANRLPR